MGVFLGIDIGTSSTKVSCIDSHGTHRITVGSGYKLERPESGWAEQNPEQWWQALLKALRELREHSRDSFSFRDIEGIGLSGQMHSLVVLDGHGKVLTNAISWADQRTHAECSELRRRTGDAILKETGNAVNAGFTLPKLLWLRANDPECFARIRHVLLPKDFIRYKLTNELLTDYSDASGTLMFNPASGRWSDAVLSAVGIDKEILPEVAYSAECGGYVSHEASEVTGIPEFVPVYVGSCDVSAAVVGSGAVSENTGVVSLGSAAQVIVTTGKPVIDWKSRINLLCHGVPDEWMLMGAVQNSGSAVEWFLEQAFSETSNSGDHDYEQLERQLSELPMRADDPVFLPYLTGERTPHMDENAAGVLFGLRPHHGKFHILRAVHEGIGFSIRDCVEVLREMHADAARFMLCGGGSASGPLVRILTANLNRPVLVSSQRDASPRGAALWAMAGSSGDLRLERIPAVEGTEAERSPDTMTKQFYDHRFDLYRKIYHDLRSSFELLAELPGESHSNT